MKNLIPWLAKCALVSIVLLLAVMWSNLGRDYLFDWDEGIYSVLGQEMLHSGDLLTPTWNGDLWLEKPPAIAWVSALGLKLAGENELGARLFMPLFAGLTLYAIFRIGQHLAGTPMGVASMAILGYLNLFLARGRALNADGMLLAAIAWTVWLLLSSASPWLVGVVMGLAIMVKGPAGILAILISLPLLIKKPKSFLLSTFYFLLLTIIPWHLYSYLVHGQAFITPYLLEQVIRRATVPIEFHTESRWFYFNFLQKDLGLGIVLVALLGLASILRANLVKKSLTDSLIIIWWVILPLGLFTLAKTRLAWYILPVYPGLALSVGYALTQFYHDKKSGLVINILVLGMLAQMLWHGFQYVAPFRAASPLSDTLQVASALRQYPGKELAMLVSKNERVAEAILPKEQAISSSFRYGGAPSVVWYSGKHVRYFYNYDNFGQDVSTDSTITTLMVTIGDKDKVPSGFTQVASSGNYLGFHREASYALR